MSLLTGLIAMCDAMYPILKPGARIVHVSGKAATRAMQLVSKERFEKIKMLKTVEDVGEMMDTFLGAAKNDTLQELGWIKNAYGTSKIAVAIVAPIHQEIFNKDISRPDIIVNACCPGHVATDMSDHKGYCFAFTKMCQVTYVTFLDLLECVMSNMLLFFIY